MTAEDEIPQSEQMQNTNLEETPLANCCHPVARNLVVIFDSVINRLALLLSSASFN